MRHKQADHVYRCGITCIVGVETHGKVGIDLGQTGRDLRNHVAEDEDAGNCQNDAQHSHHQTLGNIGVDMRIRTAHADVDNNNDGGDQNAHLIGNRGDHLVNDNACAHQLGSDKRHLCQ